MRLPLMMMLLCGGLAGCCAPGVAPPPAAVAEDPQLRSAAEFIVKAIAARDFEQLRPHINSELQGTGATAFSELLADIDGEGLDPASVQIVEVREDPGLSGIVRSATLVLDFDGTIAETTFSMIGGKLNGTAAWIKVRGG